MKRLALCLAVCLITLTLCATVDAGCVWDLNKDLPRKDPLYFTNTNPSTLIIPGPTGIVLQTNEYMTLTCLGRSNTIVGTGKQELTLPCGLNNTLLYNGIPYNLNQFYCSHNSLSEVKLTGTLCNGGTGGLGEIMELGFNSTTEFATQVYVCYDRTNEASLYSVDTIYGKSITHSEKRHGERPSFRIQGLTYPVSTVNQYLKSSQAIRFSSLLGPLQSAKYINNKSYLARGHLAPDADFLFVSWSSATYFYVNAVPQWQDVNNRNWKRVEYNARKIADSIQEDLMIFTGSHEVLKLQSDNGSMVDIFLFDVKMLRVPKWTWKIIYSQTTQRGIAFVTLNNPFATSITPSELICNDICPTSGWSRREFSDFTQGYTYCCDVNALLAKVGTLSPFTIKVSGVLTDPL